MSTSEPLYMSEPGRLTESKVKECAEVLDQTVNSTVESISKDTTDQTEVPYKEEEEDDEPKEVEEPDEEEKPEEIQPNYISVIVTVEEEEKEEGDHHPTDQTEIPYKEEEEDDEPKEEEPVEDEEPVEEEKPEEIQPNYISEIVTEEGEEKEEVDHHPTDVRRHGLDIEAGIHHGGHHNTKDWRVILTLAFQCIGVVFGDLGTSPLYVFSSTFSGGIKHDEDILGVLSLIIYTITIIPVIKYVMIVLHANDDGEGGTFALYNKLCRHAKVGLIPREQPEEDRELSGTCLEQSKFAKLALLFVAMLGTCLVVGDGILTPSISVLSAVSGVKEAADFLTEGMIVIISVSILISLFMVQRFGTGKVGYAFAPLICVWLALISGIGAYNFFKFDPSVAKAINPKYIFDYFKRNGKDAWVSLGGVVLAITGTEAMFADLGHFTVQSIQISMGFVVYPAIIAAYGGQASWLRMHVDEVADTFYKSLPSALYWPVFVMAVIAAIIASQAMISGTFSIINQSLSLGCFPQIKVVHTSEKHRGQVYIPIINYLLMSGCILVTVIFRSTERIGNAYGIAVIFAETLTSGLLVVIMIVVWQTRMVLVIAYVIIICSMEYFFLSAVLYKFTKGGYLPFSFAIVLMVVMCAFLYIRYRRMRPQVG